MAGIIGIAQGQRNLMPGAMQAACYLSGYLLGWGALAIVAAPALVLVTPALSATILGRPVSSVELAHMVWLTLNVLCWLVYLGLVRKITAGMRYANA